MPKDGGTPPTGLDLSECEAEPIHLLGHIQPHGYLLALDADATRITHVSANIAGFLGQPPEAVLGKSLPDVLEAPVAQRLVDLIRGIGTRAGPTAATAVCPPGSSEPCAVTVHRHAGRLFVEVERLPAEETAPTVPALTAVPDSLAEMGDDVLHRLADRAVRAVAEETGYDRVMIYMFHPDWSGEVIAEMRRPEMVPYLGLRYPATDIPSQARQLFTLNLLRVIADVDARPVSIVAEPGTAEDAQAPDLSLSGLRSVSPYHLEYMRNMGVAASLTASIIIDGELWGMVACHHRRPRLTPPAQRAAVMRRVGDLVAHVKAQEQMEAVRRARAVDFAMGRLDRRLSEGQDPVSALLMGDQRLVEDLEAQGAMVAADGAMALVGRCPSGPVIARVLEMAARTDGPVFMTDALSAEIGAVGDGEGPNADEPVVGVSGDIAGCAVLVMSRAPLVAIAAFREPESRNVFWAGDPNKPAIREEGKERISPRNSFAAWRERVEDRSRPWERWCADLLTRAGTAVGRHVGADNPAEALGNAVRGLAMRFKDARTVPGGTLDAAGQGVLLTLRQSGHRARVVATNQTFLDLFDLEPGTIEGESLHTVAARIGLPDDLRRKVLSGPQTFDCWSRSLGRRALETVARNMLAVRDNGSVVEWDVFTFRDVTAFHRTAEALAAARDEAVTASRQKSEFLANVSHELKTPLNAIIGFSELIQSGRVGPTSDRVTDYARIIGEAGHHLLTMINDLLDLSRAEAGRQIIEDEPVNLTTLARDCLSWMRSQPRGDAVTWTPGGVPDGPLWVRGDSRALRRVLLNLLGNALKFTPDGGTVGLVVGHMGDGSVFLEARDTGIGIPADEVESIFQPFRRGKGANVSAREGAGLGLAMTKAMVDLHGGRITVESTVGTGSTFRVLLPRDRVLRSGSDPINPAQPA
ncbi:ATP-binding protein [Rhodospira trueperi]|nr:ATP-binding protein [Rhodospira trueperi]